MTEGPRYFCSGCDSWRHTENPCGRENCPYDVATHYYTIATALDNAVQNGCSEELSKMSAEDIAYDLARLDASCERLPIEIIKAGVQAWLHPQSTPDEVNRLEKAAWDANAEKPLIAYRDKIDRLQWTLDNIYTVARRESNRQADGKALRPEMWGHVMRLCEQVGCQGRTVGVLKEELAARSDRGLRGTEEE